MESGTIFKYKGISTFDDLTVLHFTASSTVLPALGHEAVNATGMDIMIEFPLNEISVGNAVVSISPVNIAGEAYDWSAITSFDEEEIGLKELVEHVVIKWGTLNLMDSEVCLYFSTK